MILTEKELETSVGELSQKYRYRLAIYTDKADFAESIEDIHKLLELRIFDETGEIRIYRDVIESNFKLREWTAEKEKNSSFFDRTQYLDIDKTALFEDMTQKKTTGGGIFHLPYDVKDKEMLIIRYYYQFDKDGTAYKYDWRITGFSDKEVLKDG